MRVFCRFQRRIRPAHVTGITLFNVFENGFIVGIASAHQFLVKPALGPNGSRGGDIEFYSRIRTYNCTNVAPVQHCARRLAGKFTLLFDKDFSNFRDDRDFGSRIANIVDSERCTVEFGEIDRLRGTDCRFAVIKRLAAIHHRLADGAISQSGVEMRQTKMRCQTARQRAFSRCSRAVNGDEERLHSNAPHQPAVHAQVLAGDIGCTIGYKKGDRRRNFL